MSDTEWRRSWTGTVDAAWIDANGHMSEGWFGIVFAQATDAALIGLGADPAHRHTTGGAFYTAETHIAFVAEVAPDTHLEVDTTIVGVDLLRLHLFHELHAIVTEPGSSIVATQESLLFHVDTDTDRVGPMTNAMHARAEGLSAAQRGRVTRDRLGRGITGP